MKGKQGFLLLTNKSNEMISELYQDIGRSVRKCDDLCILYHSNDKVIPVEIINKHFFSFDDGILSDSGYRPIGENLLPGNNHFPLLEFYVRNPRYEFYWYIEDDVRFSGNWKSLFNHFNHKLYHQVDFISSHIRTYRQEPLWYWWNTFTHSAQNTSIDTMLRSFNPIFRISNAALKFIYHAIKEDCWIGHHEVLLPTLLYSNGFTIKDFGGTGDFVDADMKNMFYIDGETGDDGYLHLGSMRFRPFIEVIEEQGKLYHPVKTFVHNKFINDKL